MPCRQNLAYFSSWYWWIVIKNWEIQRTMYWFSSNSESHWSQTMCSRSEVTVRIHFDAVKLWRWNLSYKVETSTIRHHIRFASLKVHQWRKAIGMEWNQPHRWCEVQVSEWRWQVTEALESPEYPLEAQVATHKPIWIEIFPVGILSGFESNIPW